MVLSAPSRPLPTVISLLNAVAVPPLIALLVSGAIVTLLLRGRVASLALDHPNARSLHETPTPRLGGIGIIAGSAAAWIYAAAPLDPLLLIALALLAAVSLVDDMKSVGVAWRFAIHLASAALAATAILRGHEWWVLAAAALATAWMINLYNFMDGSDGLAGGMATIGFGAYGVAALAGGDYAFAAVNLAVAAAALGFLWFNFPPARVFMGDVGAIPLGCLAAALHIAGVLRSDWPWWFGVVVFSPFIVDASLTLGKRLMRGEKVWQAHREHYYQRLVQCGWGHRRTAWTEYALMAGCSVLAVAGTRAGAGGQLALVGGVALFYTGLAFTMERYFQAHARI